MTYEPFEINKKFAWVFGTYDVGFLVVADSSVMDDALQGIRIKVGSSDLAVLREVKTHARLRVTAGVAKAVQERWEAVHGRPGCRREFLAEEDVSSLVSASAPA
jgi:hypothetical protein